MVKWDLDTGDSEPGIYVQEITFNDESTVSDIGRNDIIVFVGANNVGKSQTLRDIYHGLGDEKFSILKDIHAYKSGQSKDIIELVKSICSIDQFSQYLLMGKNVSIMPNNIDYFMSTSCTNHVRWHFCHVL